MNEKPKNSIEPTCLIRDRVVQRFRTECLRTSKPSVTINSRECCRLISLLTKRKKDIVRSYSLVKVNYFFFLLRLYQDKINIPFENIDQFIMKYNNSQFADLFFESAYLRSSLKLDFHMHKKFKFWDWFKSCKNCLAKIMMNRISSLSAREIRKWKGSINSIPMRIFCTQPTVPDDVNAPLKNYHLSFDDDDDVT